MCQKFVCFYILEYFTLFYAIEAVLFLFVFAIEAVVLNFVYEHVHMPLRL